MKGNDLYIELKNEVSQFYSLLKNQKVLLPNRKDAIQKSLAKMRVLSERIGGVIWDVFQELERRVRLCVSEAGEHSEIHLILEQALLLEQELREL